MKYHKEPENCLDEPGEEDILISGEDVGKEPVVDGDLGLPAEAPPVQDAGQVPARGGQAPAVLTQVRHLGEKTTFQLLSNS